MSVKEYQSNCKGCEISQGRKLLTGGTIRLEGDWLLSQYAGGEGYLGWMALQTRYHRMELFDLSPDEAAALGRNIQSVDIALRQYWSVNFENDPIRRVYVVYFLEGVFDRPEPSPFHLHFHLIPRTLRFDRWLRREDGATIIAWNIYKLSGHPDFPEEYRVNYLTADNLMTYLRGFFGRSMLKVLSAR